jgi:26S proteasome non-ATPase regulatory subunit 9
MAAGASSDPPLGSREALRDRVKALYAERETLESEMASISERLSAPGAPGLRGALVDREGFPIPGVDLYAVRADRGRYATLRNDHVALTAEVERAIADLHASAPSSSGRHADASAPAASAPAAPEPAAPSRPPVVVAAPPPGSSPGIPFAIIDDVTPGSPAHDAGLVVGDRVLAFGGVTAERNPSSDPLPAVAARLAACENVPVPALVIRRGARVEVQVTPRRWGGRGLLGCHMRPV